MQFKGLYATVKKTINANILVLHNENCSNHETIGAPLLRMPERSPHGRHMLQARQEGNEVMGYMVLSTSWLWCLRWRRLLATSRCRRRPPRDSFLLPPCGIR